MKNLFIYLFLFSIIFSSCTNETTNLALEQDIDNGYPLSESDVALNLIKNFNNKETVLTYSTDNNNSDIIITNVKETTYSINLELEEELVNNRNAKISALNNKELDKTAEVKVYTVEFEKNGNKGFAISSGDERITNVYAYTENGSLSDTSYIVGLRAALHNIEGACKKDLECFYKEGNLRKNNDIQQISRDDMSLQSTSRSIITVPGRLFVDTITKLEWNQTCPYNQYVPATCSNINWAYRGRGPAGCGPISCAQVIAYLCPPSINYNLSGLRNQRKFIEGEINQPWSSNIGVFIRAVGTMMNTEYSCSGGSSELKYIRDEFDAWGISYSFAKDANVDLERLSYNLWRGYPHISSGFTKSPRSGHGWVWEGIDCYVTGINTINGKFAINKNATLKLFCNWGWGGTCNGWFVEFEKPSNDHKPYLDDNCQLYITNTSFPIPSIL